MESIFKLGIILSVTDLASKGMRWIDGNIKDLRKSAGSLGPLFDNFQKYGRNVALIGGTLLTLMAGTAQAYSTLETAQLSLTTTIMNSSGQIGPEFTRLNALANQLGSSLPGSTRDMLNMFTALREQGVQTNIILGGMGEAAAKFAVLVGVPYVQGATHVAKFAEAFGIADSQTVQFMDTLQRLKGAAGIDVPDLAESIKYVGASLKTMGIQGLQAGRDVSSALGLMAISSIEGSQAGTGLAMAMSRMAEISSRLDAGKIAKLVGPILDAQGIKLNFFDGNGQFVGIRTMIGELEKLRAINPQEQLIVLSKLFGAEAARPLAVFINQGVAGFDAMNQKMAQQADMQQKINVIMSGVGMKWDTLTGTVENLVAHIGAAVVGAGRLGTIMDWINQGVSAVDGFVTAYPQLSAGIAGTVVIGAVLATVLGGIFTVVGLLGLALPTLSGGFALVSAMVVNQTAALQLYLISLGGVSGALRAASLAAWGFTKALFANPWTWVVIAVAAVIAGLVYLYNKFDSVKLAVHAFMYALGYLAGTAVKFMKLLVNASPLGLLYTEFNLIKNLLTSIDWSASGAKIIGTLVAGIKSMAMAPVNAVIEIFSAVRKLLPFSDAKEGPLSSLTLSGARIMETLGAGVQGAAPGLQRTISTALAGAALATTVAVAPVADRAPAPAASPRAAQAASSSGRSIVIQNLTITLPGVSNAEDFVAQLQALVEGYDV